MAAPTRDVAADYLIRLACLGSDGKHASQKTVLHPSVEDMRCIYLARKTVGMMATWKKRSASGKLQHKAQEALFEKWLEDCMDGDKMRNGGVIEIDPDTAETVRAAAYALVEYDILAAAEKKWK